MIKFSSRYGLNGKKLLWVTFLLFSIDGVNAKLDNETLHALAATIKQQLMTSGASNSKEVTLIDVSYDEPKNSIVYQYSILTHEMFTNLEGKNDEVIDGVYANLCGQGSDNPILQEQVNLNYQYFYRNTTPFIDFTVTPESCSKYAQE